MAVGGTGVGALAAPARSGAAEPPFGLAGAGLRCRCGHESAAHEHYRSGSDCGACGAVRCARFRSARRATLRRALWWFTDRS